MFITVNAKATMLIRLFFRQNHRIDFNKFRMEDYAVSAENAINVDENITRFIPGVIFINHFNFQ